jgi:hypothetical protein
MKLKRITGAAIAAVFLLACAQPAGAAETSIYVAEQPGFSITFKAVGRQVFVTSLRSSGYCKGTPGQPEYTSWHGESFLGPPGKLERDGRRLHYGSKNTEVFYAETAIDAEIGPEAIVGTYMNASAGPAEGEGDCSTGTPDGGPRVPFEAKRYVPIGSELATAPDPTAAAIYFADARLLEIYLWVEGMAVTDVRARTLATCVGAKGNVYRSRGRFYLELPLALNAHDRFSWGEKFENGTISRRSRFSGLVGETATVGALAEREEGRQGGRVTERCRTGDGPRGWVHYRAVRYVPVAPEAD